MPVQQPETNLERLHLDQWWEGHSLLGQLVRRVDETAQQGPLEGARAALDEFQDALEGHFEVEERIYFPLVERYAPVQRDRVRLAREAHGVIRTQLVKLQELMAAGERKAARVCLGALLGTFREHEIDESVLVETLAEFVEG
ncbi:MAG: hemerythrin domain-containing protein [bacterium]|nr:hemerythrin domain-containing protein [bacterium]